MCIQYRFASAEPISEVMEELAEKYKRQENRENAGEKKEETVADFFNIKEGAESSDKEKEYDYPDLSNFFSLEDDKFRQ